MLIAKNKEGDFIKPMKSGQVAFCPVCGESVVAKICSDKVNHFSHTPNGKCSFYSGEISDWHLLWQSKFENSEVRYPELGLRADVVLPNKTVIEFQNSNITFSDIRKREAGYKRLIWLFNLRNCKTSYRLNSFYWEYVKYNWLLPSKPFFYHLSGNKIIQIKDPELFTDENKGGYPMKCLKSSVWNEFTIDEFISECYLLDQKDTENFNILENIR